VREADVIGCGDGLEMESLLDSPVIDGFIEAIFTKKPVCASRKRLRQVSGEMCKGTTNGYK